MNQHPTANDVVFRDFEAQDLASLSNIVADVWHADAPEHLRQTYGTVDFATFARRATFGRVVEINGRAEGVALARAGRATSVSSAAWDAVRDRALRDIAAGSPEAAEGLRQRLAEEARLDAELLAESGEDDRFELVLFAVSSETRGRGVGTKLLSQAQDCLKGESAKGMFLFTDSSCTWQYYEARGMRRSAQRTVGEGGEKLEMYVYATDFE